MTITATGAPPPNPGTAPVPTFPFSMFDAVHLVVDEYGELTNDDAAKMSGIAPAGTARARRAGPPQDQIPARGAPDAPAPGRLQLDHLGKTDFNQAVNAACPARGQPVTLSRIAPRMCQGRSGLPPLLLAILVRAD